MVRVNQAKGTVFVSVGIGQWEVFLNEVLPDEPKSGIVPALIRVISCFSAAILLFTSIGVLP